MVISLKKGHRAGAFSARIPVLVLALFLAAGCDGGGGGGGGGGIILGGAPTPNPSTLSSAVVLSANDLGMHCMDREFSIFSILPPFNVITAQVLARDAAGKPYLLGDGEVTVRYDAVADASGSINTTSIGKTDFWTYSSGLFGVNLEAGQGLTGLYMPSDNPQNPGPQLAEYDAVHDWFHAFGLPITPLDDNLATNPYSLMRIGAYNVTTGELVGRLDIVAPVAAETDCRTCHRTGGIASVDAGVAWANLADQEVEAKVNILRLHDARRGTNLEAAEPVPCARCHYSPALDLTGAGPSGEQVGHSLFSRSMHDYHGGLTDAGGAPVFPPDGTMDETCYQCHPGKVTQCQRGAMKTGGMDCLDCHGDILSVGGRFPLLAGGSIDGANDGGSRRPWLDLPRCQACHTGDALDHLSGPALVPDPKSGGIRLLRSYRVGDDSASPFPATNKRFAENDGVLYRFSKGHGGITCEGCHGSTHAVWPNAAGAANDNVAARQLQGHAGKIIECNACHGAGSLPRTENGPHGLHNVNDARWYDDGHEDFFENNKKNCQACHGPDLTGTPLAATAAARAYIVEDNTVNIAAGVPVRCDACHEMPD
ncbi:MAG: cytochrome C [Pseudomonadota bacterium]